MKAVRLFVLVTLVVCTVANFGVISVLAQEGDDLDLFEEGSCPVSQEFQDFVDSHGGLELFGYPISESFKQGGILVQYFQNARVESHPDNPDPYKVQLGLLGDELNYRNEPISRPRFLSARRYYFPETGHIVSYAFLDFFKDNGGVDVFGYPITEMHYEDGEIVQYFQRLKLEWHPDDTQSPVHVGNLGEVYFDTYRDKFPDTAFCENGVPTSPRVVSASLDLEIDVAHAVMTEQGDQVVSVLVKDGSGSSIADAQVDIFLRDRRGNVLSSVTDVRTDEKGFARVSIPVTDALRGDNITAEAEVRYEGLEAAKDIVFLVWW